MVDGGLHPWIPRAGWVNPRPQPGAFLDRSGRSIAEMLTSKDPKQHPEWFDRDARLPVMDSQGVSRPSCSPPRACAWRARCSPTWRRSSTSSGRSTAGSTTSGASPIATGSSARRTSRCRISTPRSRSWSGCGPRRADRRRASGSGVHRGRLEVARRPDVRSVLGTRGRSATRGGVPSRFRRRLSRRREHGGPLVGLREPSPPGHGVVVELLRADRGRVDGAPADPRLHGGGRRAGAVRAQSRASLRQHRERRVVGARRAEDLAG